MSDEASLPSASCFRVGLRTACPTLLLLLLATFANAQDAAAVRVESVRVGFDGRYKVGDWAPVWVTLAATGKEAVVGRLELTVLDGDGVEATYVNDAASPVAMSGGEEATFLRYVKFGRVRTDLTVRLVGNRGVLAERRFTPGEFPQPLPASRELIVSLGADAGLAEAARQTRRSAEEQIAPVLIEDPQQLPDDWRGFDSVDAIVLATGRSEFLDQLDPDRVAAIQQWLRLGGRVLLSVGVHGERVFGEGGVLADLAPGRYVGVAPIPPQRAAGLEQFTVAAQRLDAREGPIPDLQMTVLAGTRGRVEVVETIGPTQRPTVVHYPVGFGQVTLIAVDLDREPIASWQERGKLVRRLLGGAVGRTEEPEREIARGRVSHIGYEDLAGQLRAALDDFPGVTLVAFSWVAALLVLYIALIGPVDYFLLRRFGRMERTWFTFPTIVVLFCLLAWAGAASLKGDRLLVNQLDLMDVDMESGLVRGASWAHVYSPETFTFDAALQPRPPLDVPSSETNASLTWHGLPGGGLGGMNSTAGKLFNAPYRIITDRREGALRVRMEETPIQVWSTKALAGRWWTEAELPDVADLTATPDGVLSGEVLNPLDVELSSCVLLYNHWTYRLPSDLAPGARVRLERRLPDGNLVWRLTQKRVGEDFREFATPWDEANLDIPRIVEMTMWHEAAGGRGYTGLLHRYQSELDLSAHLGAGRAVLVGRVEEPAALLTINGQPPEDENTRRWAWRRIVFPVRETERISEEVAE